MLVRHQCSIKQKHEIILLYSYTCFSSSGPQLHGRGKFYIIFQLGFLIKIFCMQIVQKLCKELFYISSKNFMLFRYNLTLRPKSYFVQIMKKILVFAHFEFLLLGYFELFCYCMLFH